MDRYEISLMTFMALWWLFNVVSVWLKAKQWQIKILLGGTLLYVIQISAVIMSVNGLNWIFLNTSTINTNELIIALLVKISSLLSQKYCKQFSKFLNVLIQN